MVGRENGTRKVSEVNFYIDEGFTESVYDSCKDVVSPSTTGTVMDLMCGAWGSNLCTPRREESSRVEFLNLKLNPDHSLGSQELLKIDHITDLNVCPISSVSMQNKPISKVNLILK